MRPIRVLVVTSWGTACGIADYAQALCYNVHQADPDIGMQASAPALDPEWLGSVTLRFPDLIHLNHHDALHSRWTAEHVKMWTDRGVPVVVTYHDTTADPSPTSKIRQLQAVASSLIVHEPVKDLPAIYWRQGIPAAQFPRLYDFPTGMPILGTSGFNFPWKNYDLLLQVTRDEGWAMVLCCANATAADQMRWERINPHLELVKGFRPQAEVVHYLAGCTATAYMYECANTGTSGAIRQGIAARKPVLALETCRQFRDLTLAHTTDLDLYGVGESRGVVTTGTGLQEPIRWMRDWADLARTLRCKVSPVPWDPYVRALAHLDSWERRGRDHAQLYRLLTKTGEAPGVSADG